MHYLLACSAVVMLFCGAGRATTPMPPPPDPTTGDAPTAEAIEKKATGQRRAIRSGHVILSSRINVVNGDERKLRYRGQAEIWFDGRSIRSDTIWARGEQDDPVRAISSFGEREHVSWEGGRKTAPDLVAQVRNRSAKVDKHLPFLVVDPRMLGLVAVWTPVLPQFGIDSTVGRADRTIPAVERDILQGVAAWKVTYAVDQGAMQVAYWVAPGKGDNVVKVEVTYRTGGKLVKESVVTELQHHQPSESWFPKRCKVERHVDGVLTEEEDTTVEVHSLNKLVPPATFGVEALGLPTGTKVQYLDRAKGEEKVWDGSRLVEPNGGEALATSPGLPRNDRRKVLVMCGAILSTLSLAGALTIYARRRSRRGVAQRPPGANVATN